MQYRCYENFETPDNGVATILLPCESGTQEDVYGNCTKQVYTRPWFHTRQQCASSNLPGAGNCEECGLPFYTFFYPKCATGYAPTMTLHGCQYCVPRDGSSIVTDREKRKTLFFTNDYVNKTFSTNTQLDSTNTLVNNAIALKKQEIDSLNARLLRKDEVSNIRSSFSYRNSTPYPSTPYSRPYPSTPYSTPIYENFENPDKCYSRLR
jgi:hypothetical protein